MKIHQSSSRTLAGLPPIWQLLLVVLILVSGSASVAGEVAEEGARKKGSFNIYFENDILDVGASDRHYTNGLLFSYQTGENRVWSWLDGWARRNYFKDPDVRLRAGLAIGHNLYTPEDISTPELVADDRPYAAWLHVDLSLVGQTDNRLRTLQFSFGIVGPAAKGEEFQKWVHQIIDSPEPMGWDNQLNNELALMLVFEQKWRNIHSPGFLRGLGLDVDLSPHWSMALGNVFTYGGVGGTVRLGQGLEKDFGPPRIQPSPPGSGFCAPTGGFGWYLFGGLDGRLMLHNIFLDGNTFSDSHSVEKNLLVGDLVGGVAVTGLGTRLGFTYVVRSPEFKGQSGADRFGSLTMSFHF